MACYPARLQMTLLTAGLVLHWADPVMETMKKTSRGAKKDTGFFIGTGFFSNNKLVAMVYNKINSF